MSTERTIKVNVVEQPGKAPIAVPLPDMHIYAAKIDVEKKFDGTTAPIAEEESLNNKWAKWGENDTLPTTIRHELQAVTMANAAICKLIAMMYGNGIIYYENSDLLDGNTTVARAYKPEVEAFLKKNRINTQWYLAQLADWRYYMNTFNELIPSADRTKIVGIHSKSSEFCRVGMQNKKSLHIDKVYFSPFFREGVEPANEQLVEIPYFSPYRYHFEDGYQQKIMKQKRMVWHSYYPTPGTVYYATPFWIGLFGKNTWLSVAKNIPAIISAMQQNQISIKYQILIPVSYFEVRHPEWDSYTHEQREKHINDLIGELNDLLSKPENQFKSITTIFDDNPAYANPRGKIEIVAVDDKAKAGVWVPDSAAADAQIVQALGLHPSQMGLQPEGGKMGAGSGSDQRESFNTATALNTLEQNILLEPLNFISEVNGWGVTFMVDHTMHTTTNRQEDGLEPSDKTVEIEK